jgi:hypothetical protein
MLNVFMLGAVMPNVFLLSAIILNVVAPFSGINCKTFWLLTLR